MAGMETKLHLIAREAGTYAGISANYSGGGFSGMRFKAIATSQQGFEDWISQARAADNPLTPAAYQALAAPSTNVAATRYSSTPTGMFDYIMHNQMSKIDGLDPANCTTTTKNLIAGNHSTSHKRTTSCRSRKQVVSTGS